MTVGYVYLDYFMNRKERITRENIDDMECKLKKSLQFFETWRLDQMRVKEEQSLLNSKSKTWEKRFLSHVTYLNMQIGICGFLVYARYLLNQSSTTNFVPFLHSNSSIIEALFSQICRMQRDTPLKYAAGAVAADTMLAAVHLDNGMYSAEDLAASLSPCKMLERVTMRKDETRDKTVNEWLEQREVQTEASRPVRLSLKGQPGVLETQNMQCPTNNHSKLHGLLKNVITNMTERMVCHYSDVFWSDCDFVEYAKLSIGTPLEPCFYWLVDIPEALDEQFDKACQHVFNEIKKGVEALGATTKSIHRSFMFQVYQLQTDRARMMVFQRKVAEIMEHQQELYDIAKDGLPMFCQLFVNFIAKLFTMNFNDAIDNWLEQMRQSKSSKVAIVDEEVSSDTQRAEEYGASVAGSFTTLSHTLTRGDECKEVQMFFGWALSCITGEYESRAEAGDDGAEDVYNFFSETHRTHDEVILDDDYVQDYYPAIVQMKNRGNLALVAREYFDFGICLLQTIRALFNEETIAKHGTACVKGAYGALCDNDRLRDAFDQCENSFACTLDENTVTKIFNQLVKKTFHARVGAATTLFQDKYTSRFAVDAVDTSLRQGLKTISKFQTDHSKDDK